MKSLTTQRLIIRPFVMDDLQEAHQLLDLDIGWAGRPFSLKQRREKLQLYVQLAKWEDTGRLYGNRAVILKESQEMIGICGFHPDLWSPSWKAIFWPQLFEHYDPHALGTYASLELGIGYALSAGCRGQGYAAEAVLTLLDYAFRELGVARVFSITDRGNTDAVRLMHRVGMRVAWNPNPGTLYPGAVGMAENR